MSLAETGCGSGRGQGHLPAGQFPPLPPAGRAVANSSESVWLFSAPTGSASALEEGILDLTLLKTPVLPDCTHRQHPPAPESSSWGAGAEGSHSSWQSASGFSPGACKTFQGFTPVAAEHSW